MSRRPLVTRLAPPEPVLRRLAVVTLVNTFGSGLFLTLSALYFTRIVGLSVAQVGLGLTIAGGVGVVAGVPFGHLADRVGAQRLLVLLLLVEALTSACYVVVRSFAAFLLVACAATVAERASSGVRAGFFALVLSPERRTTGRAYLRAVTNVGIGAGSAMAAVALQADTRSAYVALILVDVATFVVAAAVLTTVPAARAAPPIAVSPGAGRRGRGNPALRDRPYLAITALSAVLSLQFGVIEIGVPLWIVGHTDAPRVMVSVTLVINTVLVVLLQVPASRGATDSMSAARLGLRGGLLMGAACLVFATAHGTRPWIAVVLLVAGITVQTLSEVSSSASGWELSYVLADQTRPGAYQGVFSSGVGVANMLAPLIVAVTALRFGLVGWIALGAVFVAAGAALRPVTGWAQRTRDERAAALPLGTS